MENTEREHRARVKKYSAVAGVVPYIKVALFLLTCSFTAIATYQALSGTLRLLPITLLIACGITLVCSQIYHDRLRGKINHSTKMIANTKQITDRITEISAIYPETPLDFIYHETIYTNGLDAIDLEQKETLNETENTDRYDNGEFKEYYTFYASQVAAQAAAQIAAIPTYESEPIIKHRMKNSAIKFMLM